MLDYSPEQLWPLYKKLPEDLKEAIFSKKTAEIIYDVCARNGLGEEKISEVVKYIGYVLLGLLSPKEFRKTLKEELKLNQVLANQIGREIEEFIFFPLRVSLEKIYKTKITEPAKPLEIPLAEEKPKEKPKIDIYREPIE